MKKILIIILAFFMLAGCMSSNINENEIKESFSDEKVNQDNLTSSIQLTDRIYDTNQENVLFSPLSLNFVLGMVASGANGKTKEEITNYLNTTQFDQFAYEYLKQADNNVDFKLEIANGIFMDQNYSLKKDYQEKMEYLYEGKVEQLDFQDKPAATDYINKWVKKRTHSMIPVAVTEEQLPEVGMLVNTIFFDSLWKEKVTVFGTMKFQNLDGSISYQEQLNGKGSKYYENDYATAFQMDYQHGFSFIGILPKTTGEFNLSDLHIDDLLTKGNREIKVNTHFPRVYYDTTISLTDLLKQMGVQTLFSNEADLSNLSDDQLYINQIFQRTRIELDEVGTKAAAFTGASVDTMANIQEDVIEISLDRPFAYLIYDHINDQVLFIGKVLQL